MEKSLKSINSQNSNTTIPMDKLTVSCSENEVGIHKPWDIGNTTIKNIARPTTTPPDTLPAGSIALKSDLSNYLEKGGVTRSGTYLRTVGGLMVGDIDMGGHTISGLPSSYKSIQIGLQDMVSVGMVKEDIGSIADNVTKLIERMDEITNPDFGIEKLFQDVGSPNEDGELTKPEDAKWLVTSQGNSMDGTLHFEKVEETSLLGKDPTITELYINGSTSSGGGTGSGTIQAVGAISNETDASLLSRIVAVDDFTKTLNAIKTPSSGTGTPGTTNTYPEWTGMDMPFICVGYPSSTLSSTTLTKSKSADKFMTYQNESSLTLLRRGVYFISFCYDFSSTSSSAATDVSCTLSLTPNEGQKTTVYTCSGTSDTTLVGEYYVFVEGDTPSVSITLSIEVTPTSASKKMWAVSFRACY